MTYTATFDDLQCVSPLGTWWPDARRRLATLLTAPLRWTIVLGAVVAGIVAGISYGIQAATPDEPLPPILCDEPAPDA